VFENFEPGDNVELVRWLQGSGEQGTGLRGCYVFGPAAAGRTHLLQAACQWHGARGAAIYLPLSDPAVVPGVLDGLESLPLVALDDVQAWIGDADAEAALLALYQGLLGLGGRLLVSSDAAAAQLPFRYPDLASRLRGLPAYQLHPLDDAGKGRVLARLALERGLTLSDSVLEFWLARSDRDMRRLLEQFEELDRAAMVAKRRVTVPLLKQVLGL